ncbi:131_t:CDS:2, partial [Paraglomus brasilianum]
HYLAKRAEVFDPEKASHIVKGSPSIGSDTVYFSIVDDYGNACSFIAAVPKDCGFSLQCRGSGFVLQEGHPNCVAPSKRPYHTIIPSLATKHDELWVCFGVMGGDMQPQGHVQVILNLLEFGFNPQMALDAPRIRLAPGDDEADGQSYYVCVEEAMDENVVNKLGELGHRVKVITGWERSMFGRGQVVQLIKDKKGGRLWAAGSDCRGDGCALGW